MATATVAVPAQAAARTKPDLVSAAPAQPATAVTAGGTLRVSLTLANRGGRTAGRSHTEVVLSTDAKRGGDVLLVRPRAGTLPVGRRAATTLAVRVPDATTTGDYRLIACADAAHAVSEASERNNCAASKRLRVERPRVAVAPPAPTPTPPAPQPPPPALAPEQPVTPIPPTTPAPPPDPPATPRDDPPDPEPDPGPFTVRECGDAQLPRSGPPEPFTAMWERDGDGWTGGDGELSVPLPDGRIVWVFADTFVGGIEEGRRGPRTRMVSNTLVVQDGACLTTLAGGTRADPEALVVPEQPNEWYWPASAYLESGELRVLLYRMVRTGPGQFDWRFDGTDLARFSLPDLQLIDTSPLVADGDPAWGGAVVDDGAFTYLFGIESGFLSSKLVVARTERGRLGEAPLEYFDGTAWAGDDPDDAEPVADDATTLSFLVDDRGWTLVTQRPVFSDEITARTAPGPAGPWSDQKTILRATPPPGGYTYGAALHPEAGGGRGDMLISYSVNGWAWEDVLARPSLYRPRFARVDLDTATPDAFH